jgi:hypothetical protein
MTSSTEAECRGLVHFAKENAWHRQLHTEINLYAIGHPTITYEDNTAAITMSSDEGTPHKKSKHFGIEWAYFKEAVKHGEIKPEYVPTDLQPADMLTKSLPSNKFILFRDMIMGEETFQNHFNPRMLTTHAVVCEPLNQPATQPRGLKGPPRLKKWAGKGSISN